MFGCLIARGPCIILLTAPRSKPEKESVTQAYHYSTRNQSCMPIAASLPSYPRSTALRALSNQLSGSARNFPWEGMVQSLHEFVLVYSLGLGYARCIGSLQHHIQTSKQGVLRSRIHKANGLWSRLDFALSIQHTDSLFKG